MNQLILLHCIDGYEIVLNVDIIGSCERYEDITFVFRKDDHRTAAWRVKETPAEIVAMQWGGVCSA
jgi:uncharacterized protein with FMN-binding domain